MTRAVRCCRAKLRAYVDAELAREDAMSTSGCGKLTKGTHPKDDLVPCGTKLYYGQDAKTRTEGVLLCTKCKEAQ